MGEGKFAGSSSSERAGLEQKFTVAVHEKAGERPETACAPDLEGGRHQGESAAPDGPSSSTRQRAH